MPSAMLNIRGIDSSVSTAGSASRKSPRSISVTDCIMNTPTITKAGAVAAAGTIRMTGVKNSAASIKPAVVRPVRPVRPPASTPEADSM